MRAIRTRYLGPTERRAACVIANDGCGNRATVPYPDDGEAGHRKAAELLCAQMCWPWPIAAGEYQGDYYWVFIVEPQP